MVINNHLLNNISRISGGPAAPATQKATKGQEEFGRIFQEKLDGEQALKFSKHAEMRLQSRSIELSREQKDKISQAVSKAGEKGVKDSLVILDNLAFVVNVRNRTVITAVNSSELKESVFTNIDGAVFA